MITLRIMIWIEITQNLAAYCVPSRERPPEFVRYFFPSLAHLSFKAAATMNVDNQALGSLNQVFSQILSPENTVRRAAEQYLRDFEKTQGFPLLLITLMSTLTLSTAPHDIAIRQCAAVFLKNMVKRRWGPETDAVSYSFN